MIWEAYQILPIAHWPVRVQGIGEDMLSNMLSFINFEPPELYWTSWSSKPRLPKFPWWDSWAENEMLCHELELWALMRLYRHEFWTMGFSVILWIWTLLGFKRDFSKIHASIDMVWVANEMKPCGVKNLSSTSGRASVGGLIGDHTGSWIGAFSRNIGITHSMAVEL